MTIHYRPALRLTLIFSGIIGLWLLVSQGQQPAPARPVVAEKLREAFGESAKWAVEPAIQLLEARDNGAQVAPKLPTDHLCALDAEVDLLASALLGLEQPSAVISLYDAWYKDGEKSLSFRTPAAVLLKAQAYRLRAWHAFDPPQPVMADQVRDRVKLFEQANEDFGKALNAIEGGTGTLTVGIPPQGTQENLTVWFTKGLPKPESLNQLRLGKSDPRERLSGTLAIEYTRVFLEWRARLYRELGDLVFRETGSPIRSSEAVKKQNQPTALAYYAAAREPLYLARLMKPDDPTLRTEADLLDERMVWIRTGVGFGGTDFYQLESYTKVGYLSDTLAKARDAVKNLKSMDGMTRQSRTTQMKWIDDMAKGKADRKQLNDHFNALATRQLTQSIAAMEGELANLRTKAGLFEIKQAQDALTTFIGDSGVKTAQLSLNSGLTQASGTLLKEYLTSLLAIERSGGLTKDLAGVSGEVPKQIADFVQKLPERGDFAVTVKEIKDQWAVIVKQTDGVNGASRFDTEAELLKAAEKDRELQQGRLKIFDMKAELPRLVDAQKADEDQSKSLAEEIAALPKRLEDAKTQALKDDEARRLKTTVIPGLRKDVDRVAGQLRNAVAIVKEFQDKVNQLKKIVEDIKAYRKTVEDAYEQVQGVIRAAKSIPVTIAAGLTTGTMIDTGEAIAKGAQAVLEKLVAVYEGKVTAQELDKAITDGEKSVKDFLDKADQREQELLTFRAKMEEAQAKAIVLKDYEKGGEMYRQFEQQSKRLEEQQAEMKKVIDGRDAVIKGKEAEIRDAARGELENLLAQATNRANAAAIRLRGIQLETTHLAKGLLAQQERIKQVGDALVKAESLTAFYEKKIAWDQKELEKRVDDHKGKERAANIEQEQRLRANLAEFRRELEQLRQPGRRLITADLIASVAPALQLAEGRPRPADQQKLIDEANQKVLRCAQWLYALTGDGNYARFALASRSLAELRLLVDVDQHGKPLGGGGELEEAVKEVAKQFDIDSSGQRGVFVLKLDTRALDAMGKSNQKSFKVRTLYDSQGTRAAISKDITGNIDVFEYPWASLEDGTVTFRLSRPEAQFATLTGFWILLKYKGEKDTATFPTMRAIGPFRRRVPTGTLVLPLKPVPELREQLRQLADKYTVDNVKQYLTSTAAKTKNFVLNPFPEDTTHPPNKRVFGRGIDGTWVVQLEEQKVGDGKGLGDLEEVRIVFGYLSPGIEPSKGSTTPATTPDLAFLTPPRKMVGGKLTLAAEDRKFFGSDWDGSPMGQRERLSQLRLALETGARLPNPSAASDSELSKAVKDELDTIFSGLRTKNLGPDADPSLTILRPLQVGAGVAKARDLLALLVSSVKGDYLDPLDEAVKAIKDVRTRTVQLENFTDALTEQNKRFEDLKVYVESLRAIQGKLAGTELSKEGKARLEAVLAEAWDGLALKAVCEELRSERGAGHARAAMIRHVLLRVYEEKESVKPTKKPEKKP